MHMSPLFRSARYVLSMMAVSAVVAGGCVGAASHGDDLDDEDGEEMWDEGPPDGSGDEEAGTTTSGVGSAPGFQLPFPCGQVWSGQTRTNHSPQLAVDFNRADDHGDAVVAAAAGKVTRVANEGDTSYGRWVEIDHGNGNRTRYAHLSAQSVSVGQEVSQGQKIGAVGNTGGSSGAHLHYEQRKDGVAVKPVFNGSTALFYGTRSYTSKNACGGGDGGGSGGGSAGVTGTVSTAGPSLTIRAQPSTGAAAVGSVADGAKVSITCQVHGSSVTGTYGTTTLWDFIGDGYVSDAYVSTGSDGQVAPTCK
jgi:hypothetical protein